MVRWSDGFHDLHEYILVAEKVQEGWFCFFPLLAMEQPGPPVDQGKASTTELHPKPWMIWWGEF